MLHWHLHGSDILIIFKNVIIIRPSSVMLLFTNKTYLLPWLAVRNQWVPRPVGIHNLLVLLAAPWFFGGCFFWLGDGGRHAPMHCSPLFQCHDTFPLACTYRMQGFTVLFLFCYSVSVTISVRHDTVEQQSQILYNLLSTCWLISHLTYSQENV